MVPGVGVDVSKSSSVRLTTPVFPLTDVTPADDEPPPPIKPPPVGRDGCDVLTKRSCHL
jgi:hypothetical protein